MANEIRIPGVEFSLEQADVKKVNGKTVGTVVLEAHVNDLDMFDDIQDKLDGLKIYAVEDFQTQVNELLREDNEELESAIETAKRNQTQAEERLKQSESFRSKREEELQRENQALKVRVEQLEALERELQDLARA